MQRTIGFAAVALGMLLVAAPQALALTAQQQRMKDCNAEAGDKKGAERQAFMKHCLADKQNAQQEKMKSCNADANAKHLKGAERKQFMSNCLKAS